VRSSTLTRPLGQRHVDEAKALSPSSRLRRANAFKVGAFTEAAFTERVR
jgi:hypothetical protein